MDIINELKLAIYESSLDTEDKEDLLTIVESTDDEEILCDVIDILEANHEVWLDKYGDEYENPDKSFKKDIRKQEREQTRAFMKSIDADKKMKKLANRKNPVRKLDEKMKRLQDISDTNYDKSVEASDRVLSSRTKSGIIKGVRERNKPSEVSRAKEILAKYGHRY